MGRPYILTECYWGEVKRQEYQLAILPWGATEAHNYHLPYGTDNFETEALVYEAARMAWDEGARMVVLPTMPFGVNTGQSDIRLTMNLYPSTQQAILEDVAENLTLSGIRKLLVVNGHGGNEFKPMIREVGRSYPELLLATCNWFQSVDKNKLFKHQGDHADEMETSLMMHAHPELVLSLEEAGPGKARQFVAKALNEPWAWTERKWSRATDDTGVGDPREASGEKGKHYFREVTKKLSALFLQLALSDPDDFYES